MINRKMKTSLVLLILLIASGLSATTIFDIQYTTDAGDGTYPSPLDGQAVTVTGIVTASGFYSSGNSNRFFMSDPEGGPWHGVFVFNYDTQVNVGDEVTVTGNVDEYYGFTELTVSSITINSSGNVVPPPIQATTGDIADDDAGEPYEGCLVKIYDCEAETTPDSHDEWYVNDGSGRCQIDNGMYGYNPTMGEVFTNIVGAVDYSFSEFGVNPRSANDFNVVGGAPVIAGFSFSPEVPVENYPTTITATVMKEMVDDADIDSVFLYYYIKTENPDTIKVEMLSTEDNKYERAIHPMAAGTELGCWITASNADEMTSQTSEFEIYISSKSLMLEVPSKPFVPKIGEMLPIKYQVTKESHVVINVYSIDGRLAATLVDNVIPAGAPVTMLWDGKDKYYETLPIGTYIMQIQATSGGSTEHTEKPIVIGAILK